jgi:hypothetical protein
VRKRKINDLLNPFFTSMFCESLETAEGSCKAGDGREKQGEKLKVTKVGGGIKEKLCHREVTRSADTNYT